MDYASHSQVSQAQRMKYNFNSQLVKNCQSATPRIAKSPWPGTKFYTQPSVCGTFKFNMI